MNGENEVSGSLATQVGSPEGLGLLKTSKRRKPKRPSLLDKAAERGGLGYSPYPTTGAQADAMNSIQEE